MRDDKGQVALEYMLIFAVSLILLIVFTLPLAQMSVENTLDVSNSLDMKADLSKMAQAIKQVYGEGQGSKQSVSIHSPVNANLNVANNYVSTNLMLKGGSNKLVKVDCKSNLDKSSLKLSKGENIIIVEWPIDSENMIIHKKQ